MTKKNDVDALDRALTGIREEAIDPEVVRRAGARVWARLSEETTATPALVSVERIRGCQDIQALIPAYLGKSLPEARALLVEDHTRECVPCRKALRDGRAGGPQASGVGRSQARTGSKLFRWAVAASLLLVAVATGYAAWWWAPVDPAQAAVRLESVEGALFHVSGNLSTSVAVGEEIPGGEVFRTAKGSRAVVRLADGSRVEMNERSELSVSARKAGKSLHLTRGSIIVEAAKQGSRHLFVATGDCRVAVTGTIFSVNRGTKGSRVSVIEGEVRVRHSGAEAVLHPGDQMSTNPSLEKVPLANEISWSRNVDQHLAVLAELTRIGREIEASVPHPQPRHETRLLDLTPDRTVVYAALPNVAETLTEAHRLLRERIEENPVLRPWWNETMAPAGADARLEEAIQEIRAFGDHLGEEIVVTVGAGESTPFQGVLLMAELTRPEEFRPFLEQEIERLRSVSHDQVSLRIVDDLSAPIPATGDQLLFWIHDDLLAVATSLPQLRSFQAVVDGRTSNTFRETSFHADIARSYRDGTTWLLAVNMSRMLADAARHGDATERRLRQAGLLDARNLIVEGKEDGGKTTYRGVLSFDQARRGIASWLAAPAPMGSLEFISPDATLAAAFVTKNPVALAQDVLDMLGASDPDFNQHLAEFESKHGVNVLEDFAAPLGGEFALALDGPVLPKPAWKMVIEVYDPAKLERTIEWAVRELNTLAAGSGGVQLVLTQESRGDRTYYTLRTSGVAGEVHYTFVDGYMVATPETMLLDSAIAQRASGVTLPASSRFTGLLPSDGNANFSAVAYQNLSPVLGPLASALASQQGQATPEQRQALAQMVADTPASLAYAYGEEDRIVVASSRPGGMFGSDLSTLFGLRGLLDMQEKLRSTAAEGPPGLPAQP